MPTLTLTNRNAAIARLLAFVLFGVPGAIGFLHGGYGWLQESAGLDAKALKALGGPLLGLGIALVFGWLAATADWSVTMAAQGLRVRTLRVTRAFSAVGRPASDATAQRAHPGGPYQRSRVDGEQDATAFVSSMPRGAAVGARGANP